ncbi:MAG: helix-turn-helix transcriptional regulator [Pseudomonadota bacterium]
MGEFALVRAAHLLLYVDVLRDVGVPVDRLLDQSRLPSTIEEAPDAYVSVDLSLDWVARSNRDVEPMELGFLAARGLSFDTLCQPFRTSLLAAPTGLARLQIFLRLALREDSALRTCLYRDGGGVRVVCDIEGFGRHPHVFFGEWLNLHAAIMVIRSVAGPTWCPEEMTFVSQGQPPEGLLEAMPDTRVLLGRRHTSVLVRPSLLVPGLAQDAPASAAGSGSDHDGWTLISGLRAAIRPYVGDTHPALSLAAEVMGVRPRTLQRHLRARGYTYTQIVEEVRFQIARDLLAESSVKIIDVAMMTGYQNPQHFSRAFRRFSGMTPSTYRNSLAQVD